MHDIAEWSPQIACVTVTVCHLGKMVSVDTPNGKQWHNTEPLSVYATASAAHDREPV
jgi:hypothetical protein